MNKTPIEKPKKDVRDAFGKILTEKLAPDSIQIHIRLNFLTHSINFRYAFRFVNPDDLTFVIHSNLHSNEFYCHYIFVTHSVSGSQTIYISIDICYTFTTFLFRFLFIHP